MDIKFSFVVPVYNVRELLVKRCINSLINQTYSNKEIIVINDGSNIDIGKKYLLDLFEKNLITYHEQPNRGVSVARNKGIELSKGEYIIFVDPDDYLDVNLCMNAYKFISTGKYFDILYFRFTSNEKMLGKKSNKKINFEKINYEKIQLSIINQKDPYEGYSMGSPWAKVFKRKFLIDNNLKFTPNVIKSQDRLFMLYVLESKPIVEYFDFCGYYYYINNDSICNRYNKNIENILKNTLSHIKKFIDDFHAGEYAFMQAYWNMCVQFFLMILRLDIYNISNIENDVLKEKKVKNLVINEPYKIAFKKIKISNLGLRRKIVVMAVKCHFFKIIRYII